MDSTTSGTSAGLRDRADEAGELIARARKADRAGSAPEPGCGPDPEDPASRLEEFLAVVVEFAGASAGVVRGLTCDGSGLKLIAAVGFPADLRAREALVGLCGICGDAVRDDRIQVGGKLSFCAEQTSAPFFGEVCRRAIAVPLDYKEIPVGVLTLFFEGEGAMPSDVHRFLRPLAQLLGLTLENDRLAEQSLRTSLLLERQAMASEIHDSLAQSLAFVRMRMSLLQDAVHDSDSTRALKYCGDVDDELSAAHRRLRELISHFRAGMDGQGLLHSLQQAVDSFRERTGIVLELDNRVPELRLPPRAEAQVWRILQEALSNVRKHSGARRARVSIARGDGGIEVQVVDDGHGLRHGPDGAPRGAAAEDEHFGLYIMSERAASLGGKIAIDEVEGGGTRVRLWVPFETAGAGVDNG